MDNTETETQNNVVIVETDGQTTNTASNTQEQFQIPPKPTTPEEEKQIIKDLEQKSNAKGLHFGDTWYVLASRWYKQWREYVKYEWYYNSSAYEPTPPGEIDNSSIVETTPEIGDAPPNDGEVRIKKGAMENYDFVLIPEQIWLTLHAWYSGGPPLPRKVVHSGWDGTGKSIEIRQLLLKIVKSSAPDNIVYAYFSKADTVRHLKTTMCQKMMLNVDNVRVWDYHAFSKYKLLENMDQRLEAAQIIDNQPILFEEKDENGKWTEAPRSRNSGNYGYGYGYGHGYGNYSGGPTDPGAVGLMNLGNTCFMNSSLQCLSNTAPLAEYFTTDKYKADINDENPLGTKGELAEEYAKLCKDLWSGTHSAIAPRDFKWKLERFAPAFSGFQQHDAQELLSFLLDGLHEDLNRVKKKPYKDRPETEDISLNGQIAYANELWSFHKERNDSIIVDWFQGQLKSTLVCPTCHRTSITFDPVMYLSLPLPVKESRIIQVTLHFMDPARKPTRYGCELNKYDSVAELRKKLMELGSIPQNNKIVICDFYASRFFKTYSDQESLDAIQDRDIIYAYEVMSEDEGVHHTVLWRRDESSPQYMHMGNRRTLFGIPFFLSISHQDRANLTYANLLHKLEPYMQRYLKNLPGGFSGALSINSPDNEKPDSDSDSDPMKSQMEHADSDSDSDSDTEMRETSKKKRKSGPLFVVRITDNYGTDQMGLLDSDTPVSLPMRAALGLIWSEENYRLYYDEHKERDFEEHPSYKLQLRDEQVSLQSCIDLFIEEEKLGEEDKWYCNKCKEHVTATKKFDLWRLPPILVIHLKRFSYKRRYSREKLETFVDYPVDNLDLSSYVKNPQPVPAIYELYAVSNHYGSLGGGHYTAYAKNRLNNKWYKFDDSSVSSISDVKTSSGYVLFYRRKDTLQTTSTTTTTSSTANDSMEQDGNNNPSDEKMEDVSNTTN